MKTRAMRLKFLSARLFSGALFLLAVMLMVFPIGIVSSTLDRLFHGNIAALFLSMGFMALCFSALALGISAWMPNRDAAMWLGFWLIIAFSLLGGTVAPESMLPGWVRDLGLWSPVRSAMRLLSTGIFNFDAAVYRVDMLKTGLWGMAGCALAAAGFMRKAVR
jgi:ABC-type multidrug transport system permease subunit